MTFFPLRSRNRALVLGMALATGTAMVGLTVASPAVAAPKKAAGQYSKEFMAVYKPLNDQATSAAPDFNAIKPGLPALVAIATSADERFATGGMIYTIGTKVDDTALKLQGLEMIIGSGKLAPENVGAYNFQAGAFAYNLKQYEKARTLMKTALDAGYTENEPEAFIAETYFVEDRTKEGLAYLAGVIDARKSAGLPIKEEWLKRGLAVAYRAGMSDEAHRYGNWLVENYPSETSWADAVAILLNTSKYENPEILDLMRLARRAGGLRDERMYLEYLDAADYRRLPAEVVAVIDQGYASGKIAKSNAYVVDTRNQAATRAASDERDLASLLASGRAGSANLTAIMAAGDLLLSKGNGAGAEEFYTKALTSAGANAPLVLTRLAIAQVDQGKYAEALANFGKVQGPRKAIADLWAVYTRAKQAGTE